MKTLLIVDDERDVRDIIRMRLTKNPTYRILEAAGGQDALELIRREHPALVILDWLMPGVSGKDVLKTLRDDPTLADIPVIMMTVKGEQSAQAEGEALGISAYLIKPFDGDLLMGKVQEALHEPR